MKKKGVISKIVFACIVIAFIILCFIQSPITSPVNSLWSLLPPVVAIGLALITKEVYSSLLLGIVTGGVLCMLSSAPVSVGEGETLGHGFTALFNAVVNEGIIKNLSDSWNVGILVFLVVLGIIVVLMNKAGGSRAYGEWAVRRIKTRKASRGRTVKSRISVTTLARPSRTPGTGRRGGSALSTRDSISAMAVKRESKAMRRMGTSFMTQDKSG